MLAIVLVLARGLNIHPTHAPLLLLDEPMMGLQPSLAQKTLEAINEIRHRTGIAIVLTEQQPGAERIATHHYHLDAGHLSTELSKTRTTGVSGGNIPETDPEDTIDDGGWLCV
jgi:ABC-type branched-subunit amino acid transport system ATPase component